MVLTWPPVNFILRWVWGGIVVQRDMGAHVYRPYGRHAVPGCSMVQSMQRSTVLRMPCKLWQSLMPLKRDNIAES